MKIIPKLLLVCLISITTIACSVDPYPRIGRVTTAKFHIEHYYTVKFNKGVDAIKKSNYATALINFKYLAEQGIPEAQYNLGYMYKNGYGVAKDYKQAVKWWIKAAEQGDAKAQYTLGSAYYSGEGIIKNYVYAYMWLNIAAMDGDEGSVKFRNLVEKQMTTSQIEKAQELSRKCIAKNYKDC